MSRSSAASLFFGIAGATIGGPFGLSALGFSLGASIGGALFPQQLPDVVGPRLDDLSVGGSGYGAPVPEVYGTMRIATNMIWTSGKNETAHTEEVGGKGAPSQSVTTFTYSLSAAFAICAGEILGVRRVWINNKLVIDQSDTALADHLIESELAEKYTVYTGSETQLPSSLQESYEGVGLVPAYRGMAYIEFEELQLAEFGNGPVNVEVEVVKSGSLTDPPILVGDYSPAREATSGGASGTGGISYDQGIIKEGITTAISGGIRHTVYTKLVDGTVLEERSTDHLLEVGESGLNIFCVQNDPDTYVYLLTTPREIRINGGPTPGVTNVTAPDYLYNPVTRTTVLNSNYDWSVCYYSQSVIKMNGAYYSIAGSQSVASGADPYCLYKWVGELSGPPSTVANLWDIFSADEPVNAVPFSGISNKTGMYLFVDEVNNWLYFLSGGWGGFANPHWLTRWDEDLNLLNKWQYDINPIPVTSNVGYFLGDKFMRKGTGSIIELYTFDPETNNSAFTLDNSVSASVAGNGLFPLVNGVALAHEDLVSMYPLVPQSGETLGSIVSDISIKAGLTASDIDVTALTDTVKGYYVSKTMTARAAIEPLQQAYVFDGVEVDGKIKYIKRGGSPVVAIVSDDLAAHPHGSETPDVMVVDRVGEKELARVASVSYINQSANYQPGEQHVDRLTGFADGVAKFQVPVALSDDEAIQIAERNLYGMWAERETVTAFVSRKYIGLVPTDVVTLADAAYRVRLTEVDLSMSGPIKLIGVIEHAAVYSAVRTGTAAPVVTSIFGAVAGPTFMVLLDIPSLRNDDRNNKGPGYYVAFYGPLDTWTGGILYKSLDGGESWNPALTSTVETVMGYATDTLADGITHTWDYVNTVTVHMSGSGALSTDTALNVMNKANVAAIGTHGRWEIIQWQNATDNGDDTFTLDTLLRGRQGTEHNTGNHESGDRFVLLSATQIRRVDAPTSQYNQALHYKPVSIGNLIQNTDAVAFTNTMQGMTPLSVCNIRGSRDGSNNLTITWNWRSPLDYTDVIELPLDGPSNKTHIEIYDTSSPAVMLREVDTYSESYSYTAAAQSADAAASSPTTFTAGDTIVVKIWKVNEDLELAGGAETGRSVLTEATL